MRVSGLIALVAMLAGPVAAQTPDAGFDGGTLVDITLSDLTGSRIDRPVAGAPFRIDVRLRDPASDRAVTDEHLEGWVRPVEASNGQCRDAARANTLAGDRLPRGTTDLARSLYGVRHDDGTVSIVDWEHSLASANMLAMVPTPQRRSQGPAPRPVRCGSGTVSRRRRSGSGRSGRCWWMRRVGWPVSKDRRGPPTSPICPMPMRFSLPMAATA